jgi:hypothetical protein
MKRLIYLCSLSALLACKPVEEVVYVPKVHNVVTTIYAHDTVVVVKVPENYVEVTSLDTLSVLTLPFAESRAVVSQGRLTHSLGIRLGNLHHHHRVVGIYRGHYVVNLGHIYNLLYGLA